MSVLGGLILHCGISMTAITVIPHIPDKMCFFFHQEKKKNYRTTDNLSFKWKKTEWNCQQNRHQYVSVHTDENSQRTSSLLLHHKRVAFDQLTNAIQMSLQMLSSWLLFWHQAHTLITISSVCSESHIRRAHMLNVGLCTPPRDSKNRLKSRLTFFDLVIFIWQYQIATTGPPAPSTTWPGSETAIHTLEEKNGLLSHSAATWKNPRKPLSCSSASSLTHGWKPPHSISLFPLLSLSVSH